MLIVSLLAAFAFAWEAAVWVVGDGPLKGSGVPPQLLFAGAIVNALVVPALMIVRRRFG